MELVRNPAELAFELEWTKRKLNGAIESGTKLIHENDQLRGMLEQVVSEFGFYSIGDLWTQSDRVFIKDLQSQLEEME